MERYIIDVESSDSAGEWPVSVYVKKVNIDCKGYDFCEGHGKTLTIALRKAMANLVEKENN